ncbi:hypothetical protein roselon_01761 [Roseibacterium elongatum DSM 19469]|uniref:Uncharacterized protein n=1 Tax=Roseicyclus elongatus DSM 19469 TaxID=1294273 RepID=W8S1S5_9RHOB|nr:hypothetical protein roselon_01761 [Roseibacterium elongatum DSM 19469]
MTYGLGVVTGTGLWVLAWRVWTLGPADAGIAGRRSGLVGGVVDGMTATIGAAATAGIIAALGLAALIYAIRLGRKQAP